MKGRYQAALLVWALIIVAVVAVTAVIMLQGDSKLTLLGGLTSKNESSLPEASKDKPPRMVTVAAEISEDRGNAIVAAVDDVSPTVVSIGIKVEARHMREYDRDFFGRLYRRTPQEKFFPKVGTGFLVSSDGIIITNHHVIDQGTDITVTLQNETTYEAELLGADSALDIAVLKIKDNNLPFAVLGDSDVLSIGEWAIAIGNPYASLLEDYQPTVTVGVISALNRQFAGTADEGRYYQRMIQTDAAINPGNSGGPLVNALGEVIGVNTFIVSNTGGSIGLGFARPINEVKEIIEEILTYGEVRKIYSGLVGRAFSRRERQIYAIPPEIADGLYVTEVVPGSPAAEAKIETGDVIYKVQDQLLRGMSDAKTRLATLNVGAELEVTLYRNNKSYTAKLHAPDKK